MRRRIDAGRGAIRGVLLASDPSMELVGGLVAAFPGSVTIVYDWKAKADVGFIAHSLPGHGSHEWPSDWQDNLATLRQYDPSRSDPLANCVIPTRRLFRTPAQRRMLDRTRATLWAPHECHYQLRVVLYEGSRFVAMVALLRSRSAGDYDDDDEAVLRALQPVVRDAVTADRARRTTAHLDAGITPLIEAFETDAYLVDQRGHVLHANQRARARGELPAWIRLARRRADLARLEEHARVIDVRVDGDEHRVVVARPAADAAPARLDTSMASVPPRVLEVARRIASGQGVEEVAADTGLTVKTVRTYLERAHACLGVRNRAELVRRIHGLD